MTRSTRLIAFAVALAAALSQASAGEVALKTVATPSSAPSQAKAVATEGAYFGIFGGVSLKQGATTRTNGDADIAYGDEIGGYGGLEFGYTWRTPWVLEPAAEFELFYLGNDYTVSAGGASTSASLRSGLAMANLVLGFNFAGFDDEAGPAVASLKPYIGAGLGAAYVNTDTFKTNRDNRTGDIEIETDGGGGEFTWAYQLFGGIEYAASDEFSIYAEYRYLVLEDVNPSFKSLDNHLLGGGMKFFY